MNFDYLITEENRLSVCDEISEHIGEFCGQYLKENRDVLRYRLSAEEYLLKWLDQDSIGKTLTLSCTKRMFTPPAITMTMSGDPQNPVGTGNGDDSYSLGVLRSLGIGPAYSYSEGKNILQFDVRGHSDRKIPVFFGVIAGALLVGILGNLFWRSPRDGHAQSDRCPE